MNGRDLKGPGLCPGSWAGRSQGKAPVPALRYRLRISNPDIGYLSFGREFECLSRFEVCKHHAIIHDACGAAITKYNVGPGYWYADYLSDCLKSNPLGCARASRLRSP